MLGARTRTCTLAAGLLVAASLLAQASSADTAVGESFRLVWVRGERTESCEDGVAIARRVSARIGREVFTESAPRSIEGVIQHEGEHWEAHVYVRDDQGKLTGSRDILNAGPDCASLDAAVTLAIALTIDPEVAMRPQSAAAVPGPSVTAPLPAPVQVGPAKPDVCPPSPPSPPQPPPQPLPRPYVSVKPCPQPPRSSSHAVDLTFRGLVAGGLLPGVSPGVAIAADVPVYRLLHASAGMLFLPERKDSTGGFGFGLTTAWLGPCVEPASGQRGALVGCAKLSLGAIHSLVYTLVPTAPGDAFWASGSLSFEGRLRIVGPLVVEAGGELVFPITQQAFFVLGQATPIYKEAAAAALGFIGLGVSIP